MRSRFDQQLTELHEALIQMGGQCERAISLASKALLDPACAALAGEVSGVEIEIDQSEREIERLCMRLLLQQQPVARDLRTISAALKMISDMERIGDQAADIAELSAYLRQSNAAGKVHLADMARAAVQMVTDSVDAFVRADLAGAYRVIAADDGVDARFDRIKDELLHLIYTRDIDAKAALDLLMAAKYLERIGDHAVNIAEWVIYSVTGAHPSAPDTSDPAVS